MRDLLRVAAVAVVMAGVGTSDGAAQKKAEKVVERAFGANSTDIGPVIGLGGIGSAGLSFGGRFERAIKRLPNLGDGILALQVSADYYSYSTKFATIDYKFKYIPIGVTANYHIKVNDAKFDPFVGLGVGYSIVSGSYSGVGASASAAYFIGRAGLRYYMASGVAIYGDVGAGAATLNAGLMFKLSGNK